MGCERRWCTPLLGLTCSHGHLRGCVFQVLFLQDEDLVQIFVALNTDNWWAPPRYSVSDEANIYRASSMLWFIMCLKVKCSLCLFSSLSCLISLILIIHFGQRCHPLGFVFTKPHQEPQADPLAVKKYDFASYNEMIIAGSASPFTPHNRTTQCYYPHFTDVNMEAQRR